MGILVDGCAICNGIGETAPGQACPVCGGTGVATAEQAANYRQLLVDAAVQAATERFRQAGTHAAEGVLRGLAQAREDAKETTARAGEVLSALLEVRRTALEIQAASLEIRSHPSAALFVEPLAPDPTDPPPGITLPAGMGGEIYYLDSLLVRQLDVWGPFNAPNAPGILANPMTTLGDTIYGLALGVPQRLGIGTAGQVLTVSGGIPAWANSPAGFANPMTAAGDLLFENAVPAPARLPIGTAGQVLTVSAGLPAWVNAASGFANPMTTTGDIIVATAGGAATRLAIGAAGQVLTVSGGTAIWQTNPAGFANPMTTSGDIIVATAGGTATRLPVGSNNQVLSVVGGVPAWAANAASLGTPLGGPAANQQVMFQQPDGSIVVLPLSTYGIANGDDAVWINNAFTFLPTRTEKYGTQTHTWTYGTVKLLPQQYTIKTQITLPAMVDLLGQGAGTELLVSTAGLTGIFWHSSSTDGGATGAGVVARHVCGTIWNIRVDGTNAGNNATGIDMGDGHGFKCFAQIVNFTGTGCTGLAFGNALSFTEKCLVRADLLNNTQAVHLYNTAGANNVSLEYNELDFLIQAQAQGQSGVLLDGGAYLAGGSLRIGNNFPVFTGTPSGPVLTITGNDGAGNNSNIHDQDVYINVEANGSGTSPQTIVFGANVNNGITNSTGIMSFRNATWVQSNITTQNFSFGGPIHGDPQLIAVNGAPSGWAQAAVPLGRTPGAPTGTASLTLVMMGLASAFTPQSSGRVMITVSGNLLNTTAADGVLYGGRWGTGTAPINGVAVTGTRFGPSADQSVGPYGANVPVPFSFTDVITGLTPLTPIWVDIALAAVTGGTAKVQGLNVSFVELY